MTLRGYAPEWLASLQVADSTKAMYRSLVTHQLGDLNDVRLTRLMPADIRRLLAERKREGYAGRTRRGVLDVLRMILRLAQNDGIVERNVAELVDPPKIDAKEPVHFSAEQARRFLEVARDDALFSLYAVALGTGLRRGELLALARSDVDFAQGTVAVRRAKTAAGVRVVPLPTFALTAIAALPKHPGPIWPYSPSYVTRHLTILCQRYGLPRLTPHGLRHTYSSLLRENGVDLETRRDLMGHSRIEMTMFYSHGRDAQQRRAVETLDEVLA